MAETGAGAGAGAATAAGGGRETIGAAIESTGGGIGAGGSATSTLPIRAEAPPSSSRPPPRVVPAASRALTTSRDEAASGAAASSASSIWFRTGTAGCVAEASRLATVSGLRTWTTSEDTAAPAASPAATGSSSRSPSGARASFTDLRTSAGAAPAGIGSAWPATVADPIVNEAVPGWPIV